MKPIERTLFRSPYILRQLGFNARQVEEGFYQSMGDRQPFTVEALAECFAESKIEDFLENQKRVLQYLKAYCPGQFLYGKWVMDSVHIHVPPGAHTEAHSFKVCVLGVWQKEVVWPLLWVFVPESENETVVGKRVFSAAEEILGEGFIRHLLVDRGYIDGEWITQLYHKGTRVTIGIKEDMLVFEEMLNWCYAEDTLWTEVDPPKLPHKPLPQREVTGFSHLEEEWKSCAAPLSGCLIRDTYPDKTVYQGLVTTAEIAAATEILKDNGQRWTLEEVYMTLTRYWHFDDLAPCRAPVAYALVHFALVAFTLLGFYLQETDAAEDPPTYNRSPPALPLPERELAVYVGPYFALLLPSELMQIVLSHADAWKANQDRLLMALRHCESGG
jgi:hypothetical protein